MNAIWNIINLERPPNSIWNTNQKEMRAFSPLVDKVIKNLMEMDIFHKEAAVLGRLIYRMKSKFRNDKGLKSMAQLNKTLITYNTLSLVDEYKTLQNYIQKEDGILSLPSRQMLEYVLIRTQGSAKLMAKIEETARYAGHFLKARMVLGHAWSISLVAYACVSRIWFLSKQILKKYCIYYKNIYTYVNKFQYIGLHWLPKNQNLPHNLESWLSLDWLDKEISSIECNTFEENTMFKLLKSAASDNMDETNLITIDYTETNVSEEHTVHNVLENKSILYANDANDANDVGEVINREAFMMNSVTSSIVSHNRENRVGKKRKHMYVESTAETFEEQRNKREKQKTPINFKWKRSKQERHKAIAHNNTNSFGADITQNVRISSRRNKKFS
ncbi:hypothetical protein HN011_001986 [Eciton burchellii]|nr:hypothetical protein HN011_001986 [Eciton burchellii]